MTLQERIEQDYKNAFKAGKKDIVETLRYLKAQMKNAEIAQRKNLDDHAALEVVLRDAKRHGDAIEQFTKGGRPELAQKEQAQLTILEAYLPAKLSDDELSDIIRELMVSAGVTGVKDAGKLMGVVMAKVRGQADGSRVKLLVTQELQKQFPN